MDIYSLSRNFFNWSFENPDKIKPNHIALYFFCIEHCNRLGWKEKFGLPTTMAKDAIGIRSYNTYKDTLESLVEFGFIKLLESSKNQYSSNIISLVAQSKNNKALDKALDKALMKHTSKQSESTSESTSESIGSIDIQLYNSTNKQRYKDTSIINNTSVEQSSTYELILKNSKDISAYIEKEKPKILKPYTDLWNLFATKYGKPKVSETKSRQDKLKVRLKENKFEFVKILIIVSKSSDFNLKSKWLNFDWILKSEANYIKILEGNYMQSDFEKAQDEQKQVKQQIETISINSRDN